METLFIADDEASIRNGLKCIIDWEELGFSLCGEASNGKDALSQILALKPGLVLLDVKMPGMHGTEVIRLAREGGFQGKCIILSGYSDFKYAQEAIRSGVRFYLTKPIDEDELIQTVSQIQKELSEEQQRSSHFAQYKNKAKNVVLQELLHSAPEAPFSEDDRRIFRLTADVYQVVVCEDFHAPSSAAPYTFAEMLKVTNRNNIIFDHLNIDGRDVVLLKGVHALNKLEGFLERLEQGDAQEGSPMDSMFLAYGRPVHAVEDLHLSYADASALLARRFFCLPRQHTAGYDTLPHTNRSPSPESNIPTPFIWNADTVADYAGRLTDYIGAYNRRMTVDTLQEIELGLMSVSNGINEIRLLLIDLYLQIKENLTRNYPSAGFSFRNNSEAIEYIHSRSYLYEILHFLSEQFETAMNAMGNSSKDTILADVLFYIDHNFHRNLKLEAIAPLFGYNSAYLGKIFTKSVGESFNSYVDHRRIEHSKKLLAENRLKVYEIAKQAGYKNVDYFHKKFRKYTGMSPAEFRKGQGLDTESESYPPP
ncbi:MAG: response regulator transcription factor [Lachnospiraceae bacterium]|nr:response regulator transcription factor [Lachnospiraceae bacterium]